MSRQMKDSGVEWIGTIPMNWKLERGKYLFVQRNSKGNDDAVLLAATQKYGMIPQTMVEGVVQVKSDTDLQTFKTVHQGDFVISLRSFQGGFEMSDYEGVCSPAYQVFHNIRPIYHKYYKHLFKSHGFISKMNSLVVGIREGKNIQYDDFANSKLPNPPLENQQRIADFLDQKCNEIDEMVALQEQIIEELMAYKQAVTTEIATHGLIPNVQMKPSGVEWIDEIPTGWEIKMLGSLFQEHKQKNTGLTETNLLSLSHGKIIRKDINTNGGLLPMSFEGYNIIGKDDIVLRMTDLQNDHKSLRTGLCNETGIITSAYITLRPKIQLNSKYIHYLLHTYDVLKVFYGMGDGVRQSIGFDDIRKLLIFIPSAKEQDEICNYLDQKSAEIDNLVAIKQQKIEELKEYKKSIIYEYITGKKEII